MPRKSAAATQAELENLIADLRDVLARKELDVVPEITNLRERLEDGVAAASERASAFAAEARERASHLAAEARERAREAAHRADVYAHDEPWRVAGAALAVGAVLGFLLARR